MNINVPNIREMLEKRCHDLGLSYKIIGDGKWFIKPEDLNCLEGNISSKTKIHIVGHGKNITTPHGLKHAIGLFEQHNIFNPLNFTREILWNLKKLASANSEIKEHGLEVHIFACFGGGAAKDAIALGQESVLITHGPQNDVMQGTVLYYIYDDLYTINPHKNIIDQRVDSFLQATVKLPSDTSFNYVQEYGMILEYNFEPTTYIERIETHIKEHLVDFKQTVSKWSLEYEQKDYSTLLDINSYKKHLFYILCSKAKNNTALTARIEKYIEQYPDLIDYKLYDVYSPLFIALSNINCTLARYLYDKGASFDNTYPLVRNFPDSHLTLSFNYGDAKQEALRFAEFKDLNEPLSFMEYYPEDAHTQLFYEISEVINNSNKELTCKVCLSTALKESIMMGALKVINLLCEYGLQNIPYDSRVAAIGNAFIENREEIIKLLLEHEPSKDVIANAIESTMNKALNIEDDNYVIKIIRNDLIEPIYKAKALVMALEQGKEEQAHLIACLLEAVSFDSESLNYLKAKSNDIAALEPMLNEYGVNIRDLAEEYASENPFSSTIGDSKPLLENIIAELGTVNSFDEIV
jgi:hypothetical protein